MKTKTNAHISKISGRAKKVATRVVKFTVHPVKQKIKTSVDVFKNAPPRTKLVAAGFVAALAIGLVAILVLSGSPIKKVKAILGQGTLDITAVNPPANTSYTSGTNVNLALSGQGAEATEMAIVNDSANFPTEASATPNTVLLSKLNNSNDAEGPEAPKVTAGANIYGMGATVGSSTTGSKYFEEGTVNLVNLPSFENGDTKPYGWLIYPTTITKVTMASDEKKFGSNSAKFVVSAGDDEAINQIIGIDNTGGTYTLSGYIKTSSLSGNAKMLINDSFSFGSPLAQTSTVTGTNDWARLSTTFTVAAGKPALYLALSVTGGASGGTAWFDGIQLEKKSFVSSFVSTNGDLGDYGTPPSIPGNFTHNLDLLTGSLSPSTTYCYKVTAYNNQGESATAGPACETTTLVDLQVSLNWDSVAGASGYKLFRTSVAVPGAWDWQVRDMGTNTSYSDSADSNWTNNRYQVPPGGEAKKHQRVGNKLAYTNASNISATTGTIEMWVKPTMSSANLPTTTLFDINNSGKQIRIYFDSADKKLKATITDGTTTANLESAALTFGANEWSHVALTYDLTGSSYKLYLNGIEVDQDTTAVASLTFGSADIYFGSDSSGNQTLNGYLDDLHVQSAVLNATAIANDAPSRFIPYATSTSWTLSTGDGTKNVYAKFRDALGNVTTPATTDSIVLDHIAPTGSWFAIGKVEDEANTQVEDTAAPYYTHIPGITIYLKNSGSATIADATSGLKEYRFQEAALGWSSWTAIADNFSYSLLTAANISNPISIQLEVKDNADNVYTATSQNIYYVTIPDHLTFTTPAQTGLLAFQTGNLSGGGQSALIKVQVRDADGNPMTVTGKTINLSSSQAGGHYWFSVSPPNWTSPITSIGLTAQNTASLYYKSDQTAYGPGGFASLSATLNSPVLSANQNAEVKANVPSKVVITAPTPSPATVDGSVSATWKLEDVYGNICIDDSTTSITADLTSSAKFDNGLSEKAFVVALGVSTQTITDHVAETTSLTTSLPGGLNRVSNQNVTFYPGAIDHYSFSTISDLTAGNCGPFTITAKDQYNNKIDSGPNEPVGPYLIDLADTGTAITFYSDNACTSSIPSLLTMHNSDHGVLTAYFKDTKKETVTQITATKDGDVQSGTSNSFNVSAATVSRLVVVLPGQTFTDGAGVNTPTATAQTSGSGFSATVNATDQYFNVNPTYTGPENLAFYGAAAAPDTTVPTANATSFESPTSITFTNGVSASVNLILYKAEGPTSITAKDNGNYQYSANQITVNPSGSARIIYNPAAPTSMTAGLISTAFTIQRQDAHQNLVIAGTDTIDMTSGSSGTQKGFSYDTNPLNKIYPYTATIIPSNSTATFYYYDEKASHIPPAFNSWTITATPSGFGAPVSSNLTVDPAPVTHLVVVLPGQSFDPLSVNGVSGPASPQDVGTPFSIILVATDNYFNKVDYSPSPKTIVYSGPGSIGAHNPVYTTSVNFSSGVSTNTLTTTLYKAEPSIAITATENSQYGFPSSTFDVSPTATTTFDFTGIADPTTAGTSHTVTVTAKDQYDNTVGAGPSQYQGTVKFTSSDIKSSTSLPGDYTFQLIDSGTKTLSSPVILTTAGNQSVKVEDSSDPLINFTQNTLVNPDIPNYVTVSPNGAIFYVDRTGSQLFTGHTYDQFDNEITGRTYNWSTAGVTAGSVIASPLATTTFTKTHGVNNRGSYPDEVIAQDSAAFISSNGSNHFLGGSNDSADISIHSGDPVGLYFSPFTSPQTAGTPFLTNIEAHDIWGNVATDFDSTVNLVGFFKNGGDAPMVETITGNFSAGQLFNQPITPTAATYGTNRFYVEAYIGSIDDPSASGLSTFSDVDPATLDHFTITSSPASAIAGQNFSVTAEARDTYDNILSEGPNTFTGTANLTADHAPISPTVTSAFSAGSWTGNLNLTVAGANGFTFDSGDHASIQIIPADLDHLTLTGYPTNKTADDWFDLTVNAWDQYNNLKTNYDGTIHFTTNDTNNELPDDYTFVSGGAGDNGSHDFSSAFRLHDIGSWAITARDAATNKNVITNDINISAGDLAKVKIETAAGGSGSEINTLNITTDDDAEMFYAVGRDQFDNFVSDESVNWSVTGDSIGSLSPSSGSSTMLEAITPGTGQVYADHASAVDDSTGNITVSVGNLASVRVENSGGSAINTYTMTTDNTFDLYSRGYDADGNLRGDQNSNWTSGVPNNNISDSNVSNITFSPSYAALPLGTTVGAITATAVDSPNPADPTGNITVNPGALNHFDVSFGFAQRKAGVAINPTFTAKDADGNTTISVTGDTIISVNQGDFILDPFQGPSKSYAATRWTNHSGVFAPTGFKLTKAGLRTVSLINTDSGAQGSAQITIKNNVASAIAYTSGNSQQAEVETQTTLPLGIVVTDLYGNPVGSADSVSVTFTITTSFPVGATDQTLTDANNAGNTGNPITITTDANGLASAYLALGNKSGTYNVDASAALTGSPVTFTESAVAAPASSFNVTASDYAPDAGQSITIYIDAVDTYGNISSSLDGDQNLAYAGPTDSPNNTPNIYSDNPVNFSSGSANISVTLHNADETPIGLTVNHVTPNLTGTSSPIDVQPVDAASFRTEAPSTPTAGTQFDVTITALDQYGNVATSYDGDYPITISGAANSHFGNPPEYPTGDTNFDTGVGTAHVTLYNADENPIQLSVVDTDNNYTGTTDYINVQSEAPASFDVVLAAPLDPIIAGTPFNINVTALDQYGNTATDYNGAVTLSYSGPADSPNNTTNDYQTAVDFADGIATDVPVTLYNADEPAVALTVEDQFNSPVLSGSTTDLDVQPITAASFSAVESTNTPSAGSSFDITVTALDQYGNVATSYVGAQTITASSVATPSNSNDAPVYPSGTTTFTDGIGTISVTLFNADEAPVTIDVADTANSLTGTTGSIDVQPISAASFSAIETNSSPTAGQVFDINITALDQYGNTATSYDGPYTITASSAATDSRFGDSPVYPSGTTTFTQGLGTVSITLYNADEAPMTIDVTDSSISGTTNSIDVQADSLGVRVIRVEDSANGTGNDIGGMVITTDNDSEMFYAIGRDSYGNYVEDTSASWTIVGNPIGNLNPSSGSSSTTLEATTPGAGQVKADDGSGHFDSTGLIIVNPGNLATLSATGQPDTIKSGVAFTDPIIVTARDADSNVKVDYTGTINFTSSDSTAILSANYTFTSGDPGDDGGIHSFAGAEFTLKTTGDQTISITDGSASYTTPNIQVTPSGPSGGSTTYTPSAVTPPTTPSYTYTPMTGPAGTTIILSANHGFGQTAGQVKFAGTQATTTTWTDTQIITAVPAGAATGMIQVITSSNQTLDIGTFTVTVPEVPTTPPAQPAQPGEAPAAPIITPSLQNITFDTATPTLTGTSFANALITLYIQSHLIVDTTRADAQGNWTYTLTQKLTAGLHSFYVTATDSLGRTSPNSPLTYFTISAAAGAPAETTPTTPTQQLPLAQRVAQVIRNIISPTPVQPTAPKPSAAPAPSTTGKVVTPEFKPTTTIPSKTPVVTAKQFPIRTVAIIAALILILLGAAIAARKAIMASYKERKTQVKKSAVMAATTPLTHAAPSISTATTQSPAKLAEPADEKPSDQSGL